MQQLKHIQWNVCSRESIMHDHHQCGKEHGLLSLPLSLTTYVVMWMLYWSVLSVTSSVNFLTALLKQGQGWTGLEVVQTFLCFPMILHSFISLNHYNIIGPRFQGRLMNDLIHTYYFMHLPLHIYFCIITSIHTVWFTAHACRQLPYVDTTTT